MPEAPHILNRVVIVSALGYFVDIYDLLLFGIVRVPSLADLGVPPDRLADEGARLLNFQMSGLLLGGILWGVLGDKRGRVSVLFGSIALYSVANIANAFVTDLDTYAGLRLAAGIGLAGELGAAVTLVSEVMPRETRGYGTAIVASVGILGAVVAALIGNAFDWPTAYLVGGGLGLVLLVARLSLTDSGMYRATARRGVARGNLLLLLSSRARAAKYLHSILIGLPIWFVIGILITFSPELARALGVAGVVSAGTAIAFCYAGAAAGDLASGFLSQRLGTRRGVVLAFLTATAALIFAYVFAAGIPIRAFYGLCLVLGFFAGYWAVFVTMGAEQFGTNLRATVATTVPNMVRGALVPMVLAWRLLAGPLDPLRSAMIVGQATVLIALYSLRRLDETHGKDLDYLET